MAKWAKMKKTPKLKMVRNLQFLKKKYFKIENMKEHHNDDLEVVHEAENQDEEKLFIVHGISEEPWEEKKDDKNQIELENLNDKNPKEAEILNENFVEKNDQPVINDEKKEEYNENNVDEKLQEKKLVDEQVKEEEKQEAERNLNAKKGRVI